MATQTERRAVNADISEIKAIVMELRDQMRDHCTKHEAMDRSLSEVRMAVYGDPNSSNGEKIGIREKVSRMYGTWKWAIGIVATATTAAILIALNLK